MPAKSNVVVSEGQVTFKRVEGHKHDGLTSSLIDTSKYSMFDFVATENAKDTSKAAKQQNNKNVLKTFIIDTIEGRVLNPAGIRIQANAISAREIIAGTITANELSSNIILVNNIIRSNNFINNTTTQTGWAIYSNGTGIFNNIQIRGNLVAGTGVYANTNTPIFANIGGYFSLGSNFTWDGSALTIKGTLQFPDGSTPGTFDNGDGLSAGSIGGISIGGSYIQSTDYDANNGFRINSDGTATFNEVSVRGAITATSGSISGTVTIGTETATAVSGAVTTANGAVTAAAAAQATADSKINGGQVNANVTSISGNTITTGTINLNNVNVRTGTSAARINIDSTGLYAYNSAGTQTVKIGSDGSAAFTGSVTGSTISGSTLTTGTWSSVGSTGLKLDSDGYITGSGGGVKIRNYGTDGTDGVTGTVLFGDTTFTSTSYAALFRTNSGAFAADGNGIRMTTTGANRPLILNREFTLGAHFITFVSGNTGSNVGSIQYSAANSVSYMGTSDRRLKENIEEIKDSLVVIKALKPSTYNYIGDVSGTEHGFIAQDVYEVYKTPVGVGGDNPQDEPWCLDYGKFTPILTAGIKDLITKIEELESRIQTLEGV